MTTTDTTTKPKVRSKRTEVPAPETTAASRAIDTLTGAGPAAATPGPDEQVTVDPRTLTIDTNVRSDLKITARFKALIEEHGVLVPLLCRRDPLGNLLVVDGQRRLVVALELGLATVPVAMIAPVGDDEARIWDQLVTNDGNERLNARETAAAYEQLTLMGRSAETIARRASVPVAVVDTALTVARSKAAASIGTVTPEASIDQLAALAEFEDDKETVTALRKAITAGSGWQHTLQTARDDRARAAARQAVLDALPEGVSVVNDAAYDYNSRLDTLLEKPGGRRLTPANHVDCPGHAVYPVASPVYAQGERTWKGEAVYVCTTRKAAGHVDRFSKAAAPQTDEQKTERRALIANNKAAQSAEPVRRAFIRELLQRKTLPADVAVYVAAIVQPGSSGDYHEKSMRDELLFGTRKPSAAEEGARPATPQLALKSLVALAAARVEVQMPKDFWRSEYRRHLYRTHLTALQTWGYELSDVERLVLDDPNAS